MPDEDVPSFEKDIRPMFTQLDVDHMKPVGFDLSSYADVKANADGIYEVVSDGSMPPPGSGEKWSAEMCARFKRWQDQGFQP